MPLLPSLSRRQRSTRTSWKPVRPLYEPIEIPPRRKPVTRQSEMRRKGSFTSPRGLAGDGEPAPVVRAPAGAGDDELRDAEAGDVDEVEARARARLDDRLPRTVAGESDRLIRGTELGRIEHDRAGEHAAALE